MTAHSNQITMILFIKHVTKESGGAAEHSEPNGAISSNKSETFFDFQNFYGSRLYLTSGQLIINAFLILLVTYFVKLYALNFGKIGF